MQSTNFVCQKEIMVIAHKQCKEFDSLQRTRPNLGIKT